MVLRQVSIFSATRSAERQDVDVYRCLKTDCDFSLSNVETFASTQNYKYFLFYNPSKMLILRFFSSKRYINLQPDTAA